MPTRPSRGARRGACGASSFPAYDRSRVRAAAAGTQQRWGCLRVCLLRQVGGGQVRGDRSYWAFVDYLTGLAESASASLCPAPYARQTRMGVRVPTLLRERMRDAAGDTT